MAFQILLLISKLIFCEASIMYVDHRLYEEVSSIKGHRILDNNISERDVSNTTNYRLSTDIIPEHYYIKLDLSNVIDYKISFIYGEINIHLQIIYPTNTVDFHVHRPYIKIRNYILLRQLRSKYKYVVPDLVEKSYNPSSHILVLYFATELPRGNYVLKMEFDSNVDETKSFFQTTYINTEGEKKWIAATRFQGIGARQVFPCLDEPALRATFTIVIKHYSNYTVMSNMPVYEIKPVTTDLNWRKFNITPAIPTYLVAFTVFEPNSVYSISHSPHKLPSYLTFAHDILRITRYFLLSYPYIHTLQQMQHIAIPNFPDNVMVNWGLNFYRLSDIIYEEERDPAMRKIEVARLITLGMVQQLVGNLVSPSWWSSLWLNDGITMMLGVEVLQKIFSETQIMDLFAVEYQYESLNLDCGLLKPFTSNIVNSSEINSLLSYPRYAKAFTILNKLQHKLGYYSDVGYIDTLRFSFRIYFSIYKNKATNLDDFCSAIEIFQKESSAHEFITLDRSRQLNAWITQCPVLKIKQHHKMINMMMMLLGNDDPITFIEFPSENFEEERAVIGRLLNPSLNEYYRIKYDDAIWNRILHLLSNEDKKWIVLTRAKLIDDAFHFMVAGQLKSEIFWEMSHFVLLMAETDYIAWYPMFKVFEYVSRILPILRNRKIKENVEFLVHSYITIVASSIKIQKLPQDILTNSLAQEIAKWTCAFGFTKCLHMANQHLIAHIDNPSENKIMPWWKQWTFCYGMDQGFQTWAILLHYWNNILDRREYSKILEFLCCTRNTNMIKLMLTKGQDIRLYRNLSNIQDKDHINMFSIIITKHARNNEVLDYILSNFDNLKPREISTVAALINIINHMYSRTQLRRINDFVHDNMEELIAIVQQKIKIRRLQINSLHNDSLILM